MFTLMNKFSLLTTILYATNVVSTPPPGHVPTPAPFDEHPPKYEYGYVVSDHQGATQGHVESRDGIFALGRYHITLPDGSGQKVTYFADDWGYHPLVTYSSSSLHGTSRTEFAMGDKAVSALKNSGSALGNLITSQQQAERAESAVAIQNAAQQAQILKQSSPQQVQIVNVGASGHHDQSQNVNIVESSTVASVTPPTHLIQVTPTPEPPTQSEGTQFIQSTTFETQSVTPTAISTAQGQYSVSEQQEEIARLEEENKQFQYSLQHQQNPVVSTTPATELSPQPHVQVVPSQQETTATHQHLLSTLQSPLGSFLLSESPAQQGVHFSHGVYSSTAQQSAVHIVTPTPNVENPSQQFTSFNLPPPTDDYISTNGTGDISSFTVEGNNVQISSYLADTNKVLSYGDRILAKDRKAEQKIIDQIQQHAKLRILQDLQRASITTARPIVVASTTTILPPFSALGHQSSSSISVVSYNNGEVGYKNVAQVQVPQTTLQPPTAEDVPNNGLQDSNNNYLQTNSLAEKSDVWSQYRVGASAPGFINVYPRQYGLPPHLAPLQAGVALLTAPEKPVPPVKEESEEELKTIVDVQKGLSLEVSNEEGQVAQYQALGYERRLVDARAQQVLKEPNPITQEQKKIDLALQQEAELRQVQNNLQEFQQKILNEIDAQHEEEQKQQEAVNQERQNHLDNLQKVSEITQEVQKVTAPGTGQYQGPEYLPPFPTQEVYNQYQGTTTSHVSGESYQNIDISSNGQDVYSNSQQGVDQNTVHLSPPPAPPTVAEIEKPVFIEKPVPIETTKIVEIEKPVLIKETIPVETTKVVEVEKAVPVLQPYPVAVTRLVHLQRPVSIPEPYGVPQPIPYPYAVPTPVGIPFPQFFSYTELLPVPFKEYHPVYISTKAFPHKTHVRQDYKPSKRMPEPFFKEPKPELFHYSHSYHTIPLHLKSSPYKSSQYRQYYKTYPSPGRSRNSLKNLRIEYGGFKPPLVPSTELTEEPKPSPYGPSVKQV